MIEKYKTVAQYIHVAITLYRDQIKTHRDLESFLIAIGIIPLRKPIEITYKINNFGINPETLYIMLANIVYAVCDNLDSVKDGTKGEVVIVPLYFMESKGFKLFDYIPAKKLDIYAEHAKIYFEEKIKARPNGDKFLESIYNAHDALYNNDGENINAFSSRINHQEDGSCF